MYPQSMITSCSIGFYHLIKILFEVYISFSNWFSKLLDFSSKSAITFGFMTAAGMYVSYSTLLYSSMLPTYMLLALLYVASAYFMLYSTLLYFSPVCFPHACFPAPLYFTPAYFFLLTTAAPTSLKLDFQR